MKTILSVLFILTVQFSLAQDGVQWLRNSSSSQIWLNGNDITARIKKINAENNQIAYDPLSGYVMILPDYKLATLNEKQRGKILGQTFKEFYVDTRGKYTIYTNQTFQANSNYGDAGKNRYFLSGGNQFVIKNYENSDEDRKLELTKIDTDKVWWYNDEGRYTLIRHGKSIHNNNRTFDSHTDKVVYDSIKNITYKLPNFVNADPNQIYYAEEIPTEHHLFVMQSEGTKSWIYQRGNNISKAAKFAFLDDNQVMFVYAPETKEYFFSPFSMEYKDYALAHKVEQPATTPIVWFKDAKGTLWLFENGGFIVPTEYEKTEDEKSFKILHPTENKWYLLENFYSKEPYEIHPTKEM